MFALLGSVALAGCVGSLHCVGMCGPFVLITSPPRRPGEPPRPRVLPTIGYQLGRLLAYLLVGTLAGAAGWLLDMSGRGVGLQHAAAALSGLTMVVIGIRGLVGRHGALRRLVPMLGRLVGRLSARVAERPARGALLIGLLAALMPCGWLYAFAITAISTGSLGWGSAVMAAFWLGTLPALLLTAALARHVIPHVGRWVPQLMSILLLAVGVFTLSHRLPAWMGGSTHCQPQAQTEHP